jgi:hypothetical protein
MGALIFCVLTTHDLARAPGAVSATTRDRHRPFDVKPGQNADIQERL